MEYLLQNELPAKFFVTDVDAMEGTLPNNLVTILNHLGPMLKSESRSIQLTAFSLLQKYDFFLNCRSFSQEPFFTCIGLSLFFAPNSFTLVF